MRLALLLTSLLAAGCGGDKPKNGSDAGIPPSFSRVRVLLWSEPEGASHLTLRQTSDGATIAREHVVAHIPASPDAPAFWADLAFDAAPSGHLTRFLAYAGSGPEPASRPRFLELARSDSGRWSRSDANGRSEDLPQFDGCDDAETPHDHFSATLAIRRLSLEPGASADLDRILVHVPDLGVERVRRRLTRLENRLYAWEGLSKDGAVEWRRELTVDDGGVVTEIASGDSRRRVARDTVLE